MSTKVFYERGAVRWRRFDGKGDLRSYRPFKGWEASASLVDEHPVSGRKFPEAAQWWIREVFVGDDVCDED